MTYQQALRYIHSLRKTPGHPDPNHIRALLAAMGNPQNAYRCIHVAGTNGKGSFCAMADSILRAAGYRTGLFTSPFIRELANPSHSRIWPISPDWSAKRPHSWTRPPASSS